MKKNWIVTLIACMVFSLSLSGCGTATNSASQTTSSESSSEAEISGKSEQDLLEEENNILEKNKDLWEKVFSSMDKNITDDMLNANYGDVLIAAIENAKDQFSDKEYEIKIDGIISMPVDWLLDSSYDRLTFWVSKDRMTDEINEVGCLPNRKYTIICEKGKIKSAGEKLQDLAYKLGVGLMDTAEIYELAEDNHEIQVFVVAVVSGLFILIGLGGMITSIRLDNMSRKREFSIYRTLGMDSHIKTELQIYEYISVWLSALILSTILVIILINTLLKGMVSYYYVENKTLFINLVKVAAGTLAILALIVIAGQLGKGKRHDKVK